MMFTRTVALVLAALPALAAATPALLTRGGGGEGSSCSTGSMQCCNSVKNATDPSIQSTAGLLGIPLGPLTGQVGLSCSPIGIISILSGNTCKAQAVCCTNNAYGSLLSTGCVPISL
ncbi:fungal hydrophobin-domain-containing protein [Cerioporus squamosus]|nr:fungal hydrophobin-domain-containing protein [Cerioporus squamosus]